MRLLAYSLLLISSTTYAGKLAPVAASDAENLKGNVLVWHDATLFSEPSETARGLHLATFDVPRIDRVGHVVAMKVVSTKGAFVEVELTGAEDCTWSRVVVPDDIARLRMFVKKSDLAPVLVKPFAKTFPDGTSISLAAGTPVIATDANTFVVSMQGDEIEVDLPAASVGHAYMNGKTTAGLTMGQTLAVAPATQAKLGERSMTLTSWKGSPGDRKGTNAIVAIEDRCNVAKVSVPAASLKDLDESTIDVGTSEGSGTLDLRDECFLPRLTPLNIGTKQVAVAAKPIYLHAEPMGKNACIARTVRIESALEVKRTDEKLRICAPATKVSREVMRSARSASGSTRR